MFLLGMSSINILDLSGECPVFRKDGILQILIHAPSSQKSLPFGLYDH